MKIGRGWVMYPMEVRVMPAVAPTFRNITPRCLLHRRAPMPRCTDHSATSSAIHTNLGRKERLTVRRLIHRNAEQDLALARVLEGRSGDLRAELLRRAGALDKKHWCQSPAQAPPGAEWFLRVRDAIYRKGGAAPD